MAKKEAKRIGVCIQIEEVDIIKDKSHDLTDRKVVTTWMDKIRAGFYDVVLATPPCSTFSRARCANMRGPPPLRSRQFPRGFPWLSKHNKEQADLGNTLMDVMIEVYESAEVAERQLGKLVLLFSEHPEDLGRVVREEDGLIQDPAAIWQFEKVRRLLEHKGLKLFTLAFNQNCFGAPYKKPTRILSNVEVFKQWGFQGWPVFDDQYQYVGPIVPCDCKINWTLAKSSNFEGFRTTGTSAYPAAMDAALARGIVESLSRSLTLPAEGVERVPKQLKRTAGDDEMEVAIHQNGVGLEVSRPITKVKGEVFHSPSGAMRDGEERSLITSVMGEEEQATAEVKAVAREVPGSHPILAYYKGKHRMIHDGGGLGSPGRWPVRFRKTLSSKDGVALASVIKREFLKWVLKQGDGGRRAFWNLAGGKSKVSPFVDVAEEARRTVDDEIRSLKKRPDRKEGDRISEIHFRRLMAMAELTGDEDFKYLDEMASKGVPLGADEMLPRVPEVFEEKTKWAREFTEEEMVQVWSENCDSAEAGKMDIWRQVDEEVEKGTIIRLTEDEASRKYGARLSVAALGAVPKELNSDKVRLIHDGSYSVDVNRRIKVRDRMRFPLIDDASAVMLEAKEISERKSDGVYVHTRGTFGIASASYWWQRVAPTVVRLAHRLGGVELGLLHLLFADDGWMVSVGKYYWRPMLFWLFVLEVIEMPLSWSKVHGGTRVQWIGYDLDIDRFEKGISPRKVKWVADWIATHLEENGVTGRGLRSALGRLVFVAGALHHIRPFLGPLFAWASVLKGGAFAKMPDAVHLLLRYIRGQILEESMTMVKRVCMEPLELFRIDAKAEGEKVVIGGWESLGGNSTEGSRWFSMTLDRRSAAWAYTKGEPFRSIAALELVAVLVAVKLFCGDTKPKHLRGTMRMTAFTDNVSNTYVTKKYLSSKFPLSVILLELAAQLKKVGLELDLCWVPRDQNTEADSLTNERFEGFKTENRIEKKFEELEWLVMGELMQKASELDAEVKFAKTSKESKSTGSGPAKVKKGETKWKDPW